MENNIMKSLMWIAFVVVVGYYGFNLMLGAGDVGQAMAKMNSAAQYEQMVND